MWRTLVSRYDPVSLPYALTTKRVFVDMINQISLSYTPTTACWVHPKTQARALLAVAEESSHVIRIYDGSGDGQPLMTVSNVHRKGSQVTIIAVGCSSIFKCP